MFLRLTVTMPPISKSLLIQVTCSLVLKPQTPNFHRQTPNPNHHFPPEEFDRVIGIHMVAPAASEAIQGFALAMKKGLYKRDLDGIVGVHPTVAEAMMNASLVVTKSSGKDPKSKGC